MTPQQIADLPVDLLSILFEEVGALKEEAKRFDSLISTALDIRYRDRAAMLRQADGRNTGTVTFDDEGFVVKADLPRKVEWDDAGLAETEARLLAMGEPPTDYIKMKRVVSETAYQRWPSSLQTMFTPHRTVSVGKPTYKIERNAKS